MDWREAFHQANVDSVLRFLELNAPLPAPSWTMLTPDENVEVIGTLSYGSPDAIVAEAVKVMKQRRPTAVTLVMDAWYAFYEGDGSGGVDVLPSDNPERRECVLVVTRAVAWRRVTRVPYGRDTEGAPVIEGVEAITEGYQDLRGFFGDYFDPEIEA